jgi:transcriptional regulator with XRE-family HTH domain
MSECNKFANNLQKFRLQKHLTQEELAKLLGYSIGGYRKIEHGDRGINIAKAIKATEILNCSLDDIFLPRNVPKWVCKVHKCDK